MRGTPDVGGIYPLDSQPLEGYGSDPATRTGKVIIGHVNGKFIQLNDSPEGYTLTETREGATLFNDHSEASLAAAKLLETARNAAQAKKAA